MNEHCSPRLSSLGGRDARHRQSYTQGSMRDRRRNYAELSVESCKEVVGMRNPKEFGDLRGNNFRPVFAAIGSSSLEKRVAVISGIDPKLILRTELFILDNFVVMNFPDLTDSHGYSG